jgi:DNA-binding LacI/PurR family transcriptional regulator
MSQAEIIRRATLVGQTVQWLERKLGDGDWQVQMPSERELCSQLLVSRTTLRAALRNVAARGLITTGQGRRTRLSERSPKVRQLRRPNRVVLLIPNPVWSLRPSVAQWIAELRPLLQHANLDLQLIEGGRHYHSRPERHLRHLVNAHPNAAWVMFGTTREMQAWFAASGLPVIHVGGVFPNFDLPSIEYDHVAIAQHAARMFAAAGHGHTAVLLQRTGSAADAMTCDAFAAARPAGSPAPLVLPHDGTAQQLEAALRRLASLSNRPTGLLVTKSYSIPAAFTLLPRLGIRIPQDISVICREDDSFLGYFFPSVARYASDSAAIARKLAVRLGKLTAGVPLKVTHDRLMPRFIAGDSLQRVRDWA